jgi:monoamine oxidase
MLQIDVETHTELARVRDMVEADCQKLDLASEPDKELDSMTFAAYLDNRNATATAVRTATIWTRAMLGQEPTDISALFFLQYCKAGGGLLQMRSDRKGGGQHLRMRQGTQYIAKSLAATLPDGVLRPSTAVTSIQQVSPDLVRVQTSAGAFQATKVICAVPPTVLRDLTAELQLSAEMRLALSSYAYGFYMKVMARFKSPFWVSRGFCGLGQSFTGSACIFRDTSVPAQGKHILTCFMAGETGRRWAEQPEQARKEVLLKQIGDTYGVSAEVQSEFVELLHYEWRTDAFTGYGCPSPALKPGVLTSMGTQWKRPVGGVHFVGTEFSNVWRGYMEGAVRSGESGGEEVVAELKQRDPRR